MQPWRGVAAWLVFRLGVVEWVMHGRGAGEVDGRMEVLEFELG